VSEQFVCVSIERKHVEVIRFIRNEVLITRSVCILWQWERVICK